jgi:6-phosphogluconolactonase
MDGVKSSTRHPALWTRRSFLASTAATLAATKVNASPSAEKILYIGSGAKGEGAGIHAGIWNPTSATLSNVRLAAPADGPSFLAASNIAGKRTLFAGYLSGPKEGALSSYSVAPNGELTLINTVAIPDFDFVHTALDHTQRCLITASYGTGKVFSVKISSDGRLSAPVSQFQLSGHGPHPTRQTKPHAHGVAVSPENKFVFISDLGTDRINIYKLNPATAELTPNDPAYFATTPGAGPRHLAFHPNGKWAYSVNELDSTITQMSWNAAKGTLALMATTPTLPRGGDVATNRAGEVVFDKTGHVLYSCNRAAPDEVLIYTVDPAGKLTLFNRLNFGGKEARHFTISPDGGSFVLAEQFSDRVSVFSRDLRTGALKPTDHLYPVKNPTCVVFV